MIRLVFGVQRRTFKRQSRHVRGTEQSRALVARKIGNESLCSARPDVFFVRFRILDAMVAFGNDVLQRIAPRVPRRKFSVGKRDFFPQRIEYLRFRPRAFQRIVARGIEQRKSGNGIRLPDDGKFRIRIRHGDEFQAETAVIPSDESVFFVTCGQRVYARFPGEEGIILYLDGKTVAVRHRNGRLCIEQFRAVRAEDLNFRYFIRPAHRAVGQIHPSIVIVGVDDIQFRFARHSLFIYANVVYIDVVI